MKRGQDPVVGLEGGMAAVADFEMILQGPALISCEVFGEIERGSLRDFIAGHVRSSSLPMARRSAAIPRPK